MGRSRPLAPASSSIDRPTDSGRASSSPRTVTAGVIRLEHYLALVRCRNLQLFAVLGNRAPRQHQSLALQDVDDLRVAERLLRVFAFDDLLDARLDRHRRHRVAVRAAD